VDAVAIAMVAAKKKKQNPTLRPQKARRLGWDTLEFTILEWALLRVKPGL
jgi:hypothetical protein